MDVELDLVAVEAELCRIPEVSVARIVTSEAGRPVEVHVLATAGKHAKQVVRDVQSVALAQFGLELDHRIISVVQLDEAAAAAQALAEPAPDLPTLRVVIESVTAVRDGLRATTQVTLRGDEARATGVAEGSSASGAAPRLVAQATLDALRTLVPAAGRVDIEAATLLTLGERRVAVVALVLLVPPYEEVVSGSAVVRGGAEHDAISRAVLDATNRRLAQLA